MNIRHDWNQYEKKIFAKWRLNISVKLIKYLYEF